MALKSTVVKAELQISDLDRHYYATHNLTVAQHPSETDERLMVRLLAFALFAEERLEFGRGLSQDDEPDIWLKELTGEIDLWLDLGQPEEARIRKACGRARRAVVVTYSGRSADIWWEKNSNSLARSNNLTVIDIAAETVSELTALMARTMRLNVMIQDGEVQVLGGDVTVEVRPLVRQAAKVVITVLAHWYRTPPSTRHHRLLSNVNVPFAASLRTRLLTAAGFTVPFAMKMLL